MAAFVPVDGYYEALDGLIDPNIPKMTSAFFKCMGYIGPGVKAYFGLSDQKGNSAFTLDGDVLADEYAVTVTKAVNSLGEKTAIKRKA